MAIWDLLAKNRETGVVKPVRELSPTEIFIDGNGAFRAINPGGDNPLGLDTFNIRPSGKVGIRSAVSAVENDAVDLRWFRAGDHVGGVPQTLPAGARILVLGAGSFVQNTPGDGTGPTNSTVANIEFRAEFNTPQEDGSRPGFIGIRATPIGKENAQPQAWFHAHEDRPAWGTGWEVFYKDGNGETDRKFLEFAEINGRRVLALPGGGGGGGPTDPDPTPPSTNRGCLGMVALAAPWVFGIFGLGAALGQALA